MQDRKDGVKAAIYSVVLHAVCYVTYIIACAITAMCESFWSEQRTILAHLCPLID